MSSLGSVPPASTLLFGLPTRCSPTGNHTGYGQFKGTKTSGQQIRDLYTGLDQSHLTDFDVLLSGYAGSAEAVQAIGEIARDLKAKSTSNSGSFFWGEFESGRAGARLERSKHV